MKETFFVDTLGGKLDVGLLNITYQAIETSYGII